MPSLASRFEWRSTGLARAANSGLVSLFHNQQRSPGGEQTRLGSGHKEGWSGKPSRLGCTSLACRLSTSLEERI